MVRLLTISFRLRSLGLSKSLFSSERHSKDSWEVTMIHLPNINMKKRSKSKNQIQKINDSRKSSLFACYLFAIFVAHKLWFLAIKFTFATVKLYFESQQKLCKQIYLLKLLCQLAKAPGINRHSENIKTPFSGDNRNYRIAEIWELWESYRNTLIKKWATNVNTNVSGYARVTTGSCHPNSIKFVIFLKLGCLFVTFDKDPQLWPTL